MLCYGTGMNTNILLMYLLKISLTHFMTFHSTGFFLYFQKYVRKQEVSSYFQGALKEIIAMQWVKSHLIFSYLFCYLFK